MSPRDGQNGSRHPLHIGTFPLSCFRDISTKFRQSYAWHLAEVTRENEPQPEHARAVEGVGEDMKNLYQEVFMLLLSRTESSVTNRIPTP